MQKDFDKWNSLKKIFEKENRELFAHPREVWWCSLGVNLGAEIDGKNDSNDFKKIMSFFKDSI